MWLVCPELQPHLGQYWSHSQSSVTHSTITKHHMHTSTHLYIPQHKVQRAQSMQQSVTGIETPGLDLPQDQHSATAIGTCTPHSHDRKRAVYTLILVRHCSKDCRCSSFPALTSLFNMAAFSYTINCKGRFTQHSSRENVQVQPTSGSKWCSWTSCSASSNFPWFTNTVTLQGDGD